MKGKYRIVVQNRRIKYDFEIKRNITIIRGDSATGKTTLVDLIHEFDENGTDSGIELVCEKRCTVIEGRNWKIVLSSLHDTIVFIDEGNPFVSSKEFASTIQNTDNYYVIVTRERLPMLPYSVQEIYGIRKSSKYGGLKQIFNEVYDLYGNIEMKEKIKPDLLIVEDSASGYDFFSSVCSKEQIHCISANGKSNIFSRIVNSQKSERVLIIADGAAFGSEIEKVVSYMNIHKNIYLYLPESFEWLILKSDLFRTNDVANILNSPENYIESAIYFSWERYFTELLIQKTQGTYLQYSKLHLNESYKAENIQKNILSVMKHISLF